MEPKPYRVDGEPVSASRLIEINTPESKRSGEVELMVYEELHPPHKGAITTYAVPVWKDPNDDKSMKLIHKSGPYKWTEGDGLGGK